MRADLLLSRGRRSVPRGSTLLWSALSAPFLLFVLLPIIGLLVRAGTYDVVAVLADEGVRSAIRLSAVSSVVTTGLAIVFGTPLAMLLGRVRFRLRGLIDTVVDLPLVLPPAVAGLALLLTFGRRGLLGAQLSVMGVELPFTTAAVVVAQLFVAAPFYVRAATIGFAAVERELIEAAELDGAGKLQTLRYVVLPMAGSAIAGGAIMTWARALGEFGATIIFAGNFPGKTQTMPIAIYLGFQLDLDTAIALSLLLVAASFLVLLLVRGVLQRRIHSMNQAHVSDGL